MPRPKTAHPSAAANNARFTVGRDHHGWWVVQDRAGLVGGLFASEDAALHFAATESDRRPGEVCRAPRSAVVELDAFTSDTVLTPEPRAARTSLH